MEHALRREWSTQMAKAGRNVSEEHGITLIRADDPAMGRYLAKVGLELTMGPLKTGRHDSWSMWQIAATAMDRVSGVLGRVVVPVLRGSLAAQHSVDLPPASTRPDPGNCDGGWAGTIVGWPSVTVRTRTTA